MKKEEISLVDRGIDVKGLYAKVGIIIPSYKERGDVKVPCPKCSHRHASGDRALSASLDNGRWLCHRTSCLWSGSLLSKYTGYPYTYLGEDGQRYTKLHIGKPGQKCAWVNHKAGVRLKPYGQITAGERLYFCEGEPDAAAVIGEDLNAITMSSTSELPIFDDIKEAKEICILWDRDKNKAGEIRRDQLANLFNEWHFPYRIINLPEQYKDVALYIEDGHRGDALEALANNSPLICTAPPFRFSSIDLTEMDIAAITAPVIADNYLYEDVRMLSGSGGVGKSSVCLLEAIQIALGRKVHGHQVRQPGKVIYITAEDKREYVLGRLREIMFGLHLSQNEIIDAIKNLCVIDVTQNPFKITQRNSAGDLVVSDALATEVLPYWTDQGIKAIYLDPLSSFSVGVENSNDDASVLLAALRQIQSAAGCVLTVVHHEGKARYREGSMATTTHQYVSRGASALVDGCRMVDTLRPATDEERTWMASGREGGWTYLVFERTKSTYATQLDPIYLARKGFEFEQIFAKKMTEEDKVVNDQQKIIALIRGNPDSNYTRASIRARHHRLCGLSRQRAIDAVDDLLDSGLLIINPLTTATGGAKMKRLSVADPQNHLANQFSGKSKESSKTNELTTRPKTTRPYIGSDGGALSCCRPSNILPDTKRTTVPDTGQHIAGPSQSITYVGEQAEYTLEPNLTYWTESEQYNDTLMDDCDEYMGLFIGGAQRESGANELTARGPVPVAPGRRHNGAGRPARQEAVHGLSKHVERIIKLVTASTKAGLTVKEVSEAMGMSAYKDLERLRVLGLIQRFRTQAGEWRYRGPQH